MLSCQVVMEINAMIHSLLESQANLILLNGGIFSAYLTTNRQLLDDQVKKKIQWAFTSRSESLNSYGMFHPRRPNFLRSWITALKRQRPYSSVCQLGFLTHSSYMCSVIIPVPELPNILSMLALSPFGDSTVICRVDIEESTEHSVHALFASFSIHKEDCFELSCCLNLTFMIACAVCMFKVFTTLGRADDYDL